MKRAEAISLLESQEQSVRRFGATSLYLFGSTARDEAGSGSDLDLFIDYDPTEKFSLLDLVGIQQLLEEELAVRVDVTTRSSLHPLLKSEIEQTAVRVF
ncbi:nucleotidyltransferase family protein [Rhizobium sp. KVB221]|uniref:Nucleotidyltransferase family protein n=1 Tax=Rhizobium setariae TaxID=2801340 RepID=A0A937CNL4_9HYPH|nr:nucleotidyltransferase family protein [Rhizobium setariae]MBL0370807.1 nucleotidyltransferase family protein [Rhizobium setariae]